MKRHQDGITTVEFAIAGTVFLIALFAVIEFGRALFTWNTLSEVTRRGARVAAVCPVNDPAIARVAVFADPGDGSESPVLPNLTTGNIVIEYLDGAGAVIGDPASNFGLISYVRVSLTGYQLPLFIPMVSAILNAPDFQTTLPRESLGVVPGVGTQCF